jgi:hypothetical protein
MRALREGAAKSRTGAFLSGPRLAAMAMAFALAGCVEQVADFQAASLSGAEAIPTSVMARRADFSPRGAPVALASLEGTSQAVTMRFAEALVGAAASRELTLVEMDKARYLVRGYLGATPVEGGLAFGYVWDVFDTRHTLARRLSDSVIVKAGSGVADPWSLADDAVIASLVAKAADNLAAFLSTTPEAAARSAGPAVAIRATQPRPLGYAPATGQFPAFPRNR